MFRVIILSLLLVSCNSILRDEYENVKFISDKPTQITINGTHFQTPANIRLKKDQNYWPVVQNEDGVGSEAVLREVRAPAMLLIVGNWLFGPVVGVVGTIVDFKSGAVYDFKDNVIIIR